MNLLRMLFQEFKIQNPRLYNNILPDKKSQMSVSDFLDKIKNETTDTLQENYFKNRQRTSTKNGIPKVDAVVLFLKALQNNGVEYLQDLQTAFYNSKLENNIKSIPGQNSGISLKYFYMFSGFKDLIKPDRMILSFLKDRFNKSFNHDEALVLLMETAVNLSKELGMEITPAFLDNKIWYYQRSKII